MRLAFAAVAMSMLASAALGGCALFLMSSKYSDDGDGDGDADTDGGHDGGSNNQREADASSPSNTTRCEPNPAIDDDAPWPLFAGCMTNIGQSTLVGPRASPVAAWTHELNGEAFGPPAIDRNLIYVGVEHANKGVLSVAFDGRRAWTASIENSCCGGITIARDGTLLAGTSWAVSAISATGTVAGKIETPGEVDTAPIVAHDGTIYVATLARSPSLGGSMLALDPSGPKIKWSSEYKAGAAGTPAITNAGLVILPTTDGQLRAFRPDGSVAWTSWTGESLAGPAVVANDSVYVMASPGHLFAFDLNGSLRWKFPVGTNPGEAIAPAVGADDTIYVGTGGGAVVALTPDGVEKWSYVASSALVARPIIDAEGTIFVASHDGFVHALTREGQARWPSARLPNGGRAQGLAIGPNRTLYVSTASPGGLVALVEPSTGT